MTTIKKCSCGHSPTSHGRTSGCLCKANTKTGVCACEKTKQITELEARYQRKAKIKKQGLNYF